MGFELTQITARFGAFTALDDVSLTVRPGELLALLGPSGCGKTTLLRVMAGLETPERGRVMYDGQDVTAKAPAARGVGFVFQHYALFKHMTVFENVAFGLRVRGAAESHVKKRVTELLTRVRLEQFAQRAPSQLSGGQRQRIALARALAAEPRVLLLDEPFGALDARVRHELRGWLRILHEETQVTTVLVTHDREDAFEVADRVVVMHAGRIEQIATPEELFRAPSSAWVMRFLGDVNEYPHVIEGPGEGPPARTATRGVAYVRPHELDLSHARQSGASVPARVRRVSTLGSVVRVELDMEPTGALVAEIAEHRFRELEMRRGDRVFASARALRVFDAPTA